MDLTGKTMKSRFYLFILAVAAMAGCQNEKFQLQNNTADGLQFTGTTEGYAPETRTALDSDMNVVWKQGDQLSIFVGKTLNQQFQVQNSCDGKIDGAFDPVSSPGFVSSTAIQNNVGYYPYSSSTTLQQDGQNYMLSTTLPAQQTYAANSFGSGAFPMVAVTEDTYDTNLKFKNLLGCIKLQLKGTAKIKSIKISGNNNEILCGPATVTAAYGSLPNIEMSPEGGKEVTLDCGTGVQLNTETATDFIIAMPNLTFTKGFTVTITDNLDNDMTVLTEKERKVNRSAITKMAAIYYEGEGGQKPLTFTSTGSTTIALQKVGTPYDIALEYKVNHGAWTSYSIGTVIPLNDKDQISFQAGATGNSKFNNKYGYYYFKLSETGKIAVSGNIMSLANQNMNSLNISNDSYFYSLFKGCTSLTTAPDLPATTLTNGCYERMFYGCTSLTIAPELPATTLTISCYAEMFYGCTSLTIAPTLPATTLAEKCYIYMFNGCTSLSIAPALPATTLDKWCYANMFNTCTSLTTAPTLPATTLAERCYWCMFASCNKLVNTPELPATVLASFCYRSMFALCTSLTTAPKLPATILMNSCYTDMFEGCTSLTTAPELPAKTLESDCYSYMFYGCTKLNYIKALFTTSPSDTYTKDWLSKVSSTGTFVKSKDATWNVTGTNGIPSGWITDIDGVTHNGYEYVDLGLSVKWATMNVGATTETGYGDYFAWGTTEPLYEHGYAQENPQSHWKTGKSAGYTCVNTPYQTANTDSYSSTKWTKYLGSTTSSYKDASATDANALKTVLDSIDDAASVNWGGIWRMPTKAEQDELRINCTWNWYGSGNTEFNGVAGYKVTSKKSGYTDKFIFLPAAGCRNDTGLNSFGSHGYYWSSSLSILAPCKASSLYLSSDNGYWGSNYRYYGLSVRPVCQ